MNDLDLRAALHRDAELAGEPSPDLLDRLLSRRQAQQRRQRAGIVATALAVAVIAAGIPVGQSLLAQGDRSPVDQAPVTTAPSVDPTPTEVPEPTPVQEVSPAPPEGTPSTTQLTRVVSADEPHYFQAPSGNIACEMAQDHVTCQIGERTFEQPAKPSDCEWDYGESIGVEGEAPAEFLCMSDTVFGAIGTFELAYGEQVSNGVVTCTSASSGMTCSTVSGIHGFQLSRASYRLY
jgi:hypothetical protein